MAHYSYVMKQMLQPEDRFVSVIDTFDTIGQVLEKYNKVKEKEFNESDVIYIITQSMFGLGFYPFWQAHGAALRPIMLNALNSEGDIIENFFVEAIPMAMTTAMPNRQTEYFDMKEQAKKLFER